MDENYYPVSCIFGLCCQRWGMRDRSRGGRGHRCPYLCSLIPVDWFRASVSLVMWKGKKVGGLSWHRACLCLSWLKQPSLIWWLLLIDDGCFDATSVIHLEWIHDITIIIKLSEWPDMSNNKYKLCKPVGLHPLRISQPAHLEGKWLQNWCLTFDYSDENYRNWAKLHS